MKRVLSLVLILVLVLGTIMPAFAEVATTATVSVETAELASFGVIAGDAAGFREADDITRAEFAVVLSQLYGMKDTAEAYELPASFTDVATHWGKNYVAYAEKMGWMSGDGVGMTFRPNDPMSTKEMNAMFLKVLGYDVEWANVDTAAADAGIVIAGITRGDAFKALRAVLDLTPVDGTTTLGATLELENYVAPVVVVEGGVEVVSVTALNLMQIEVVYNQEIDDAGDETDYSVTTDGTATITADSDFDLSEDGTTVVITMTTAAEQQEVLDLDIENVTEEDTTVEVEFLDLTIPSVVSAEAVGNDTIKVFFSEPMKLAGLTSNGNYAVEDADGDTLYIKNVTEGANNMSALVELYSDLEGDVVITVSDVKDYNDFTALDTDLDVEVTIDEDAPVVVSYKDASETGVTLVFNEDIELAGDEADFYHTNTSDIADTVTVSDNEVELTFAAGDELPVGTAYIYVAADAVNDLWDNDNDKITVVIEVVIDETAPVVDGEVEVTGQNVIEVTFDEDVVEGDDFEVTLLKDGEEEDNSATVSITDEVMEITFADDLYGEYSVVLVDVEDEFENEMADTTLTFTVEDETDPTESDFSAKIYNAGTADQLIVIDFGQELAPDMIQDKAMYWFGANSFDDDDVEITVIEDGVEIECPAADVFVLAANDVIQVGRFADMAGNLLDTLTADITLVNGSIDLANPSVELTSPDTVLVTVEDELTDIDTTKFSFDQGVVISKVKTTTNSDGETEITFTLGGDVATNATSGGAITLTIAADAGSNQYGQDLPATGIVVADECAPEVIDDGVVLVNATTITITFSEALNANTFAALGHNGFSVSGGDADIDDAVNAVELTAPNVVTITGEDFTEDTNVYYDDAHGIEDVNGNDLESFSQTDELEVPVI